MMYGDSDKQKFAESFFNRKRDYLQCYTYFFTTLKLNVLWNERASVQRSMRIIAISYKISCEFFSVYFVYTLL